MNAKKLSIGLFAIIFILFSVFSVAVYDKSDSVDTIICFEGSYAHTYAQEHDINFELISDSDAYIADLSLERFSYNFKDGEGEIVSYLGNSEKIAIPTNISGNIITKIRANAFDNAENLKTIYIPKSVTELEIKDSDLGALKGVTIYLYEDTELYNTLSTAFYNAEGESVVTIKAIPDSYYVNFYSADIPYSYNVISNNEIDVTDYHAGNDFVCVPQSIDTYTVTAISFDVFELGIKSVLIPENVTEIKTDLYIPRYDVTFAIGMGLALLALVISSVFVATLKVDTKEKMFLTIPQIRTAFISLVLGIAVSGVYLFAMPTPVVIVSYVAVYGICAIIIIFAKAAKKEVERIDENVKTQTFFIKALTVEAATLVAKAKSPEIKSEVTKVYEAVRYSDPMSNEALENAETLIASKYNEFQTAVSQNDLDAVKTLSNELLLLIKDRNSKCKILK